MLTKSTAAQKAQTLAEALPYIKRFLIKPLSLNTAAMR